MVKLGTLVGFSVVGFGACCGMGYLFHKAFIQKISSNPIFVEAMETVKSHRGAIYLLGEPIESKAPVLSNKGILLDGYSDVQVRVCGPKSGGIVFLKVIQGPDERPKIDSIQLQIGNDYSKRLLIKQSEQNSGS